MKACMGGWCKRREHCQHYHANSAERRPSERLCIPGADGVGALFPIRIVRAAGSWSALEQAVRRNAAGALS